MIKDTVRWASGRGVGLARFLTLVAGASLGLCLSWWFPLYLSESLVPERTVAVSNWEVIPALAATVWLVWSAPRMPTWELGGPTRLKWYAGAACAVGLVVPVIVAGLAWWWLNSVPSWAVPFYHRVFILDGERLADQPGAWTSLAHSVTGAVALTALAGIGICLFGKVAGAGLAAAIWIAAVLVQSSLGGLGWFRAPNYRVFGVWPVVTAVTLAVLCLAAWCATKGRKVRRWRFTVAIGQAVSAFAELRLSDGRKSRAAASRGAAPAPRSRSASRDENRDR
jgi:hypothetical protein